MQKFAKNIIDITKRSRFGKTWERQNFYSALHYFFKTRLLYWAASTLVLVSTRMMANWKGQNSFCSICHVDSHTSTHHYAAVIYCGIPSLNRPSESVVEEIRDDFKIATLDFGLLYQITVGCINYGKLEMLTGSQSITLSNKLKLKSKTIIVYYWASPDKQKMSTVLLKAYMSKRQQKAFSRSTSRCRYGAVRCETLHWYLTYVLQM